MFGPLAVDNRSGVIVVGWLQHCAHIPYDLYTVFINVANGFMCAHMLPGTTYGTEASTITILTMQSSGDCCSACSVHPDCRYWVFRRCKNTCTLKREEGAGPGFFVDARTVAGGVRRKLQSSDRGQVNAVALLDNPGGRRWDLVSPVDPSAQWIWSRGGAAWWIPGAPTNPPTTFSYVYRAASAVTANIYVTAYDYVWIYINGMQTGTSKLYSVWNPIPPVSVTLQKGPNLIQMRVQNSADLTIAGVIMSLQDSNGQVLVRSNASWVWSERPIYVADRVCVQP
ncbi:hypothetical protein VOLCADRAFT_91330 [Volvox carteri f. nagariensis]|uniref:Apple domain-containing protein n=1 Tax=Volvox carteri f. nagariensis TaxID=3068 RepID=D8TWS6_VOLCA|nr:uncharacterized protein VOLCADRAFT_91330 [Volvox carteri f. nagariensis]EFJ48202.1 hypothetical protein VOLCADRAFT_91330 [Volvox carteri f. nagariensis]|eukprot:XP_002950887.1 hypothetical protein VOLCADRAFT_91330 [Volvox carteri f. nagariensis]